MLDCPVDEVWLNEAPTVVWLALALLVALAPGLSRFAGVWMGRQPDGSFLVSTGQRIEPGAIAFTGRPSDLALHPSRNLLAVLNKKSVFLATAEGVIEGSEVALGTGAGFRGLVWTPDGERLAASTEFGHIQFIHVSGNKLFAAQRIPITPKGQSANPVPGGMAITRDGSKLYVAAANRNAIVVMDLPSKTVVKEYPVQYLPFEPRLSEDESTLIVSNWGGRPARPGERTAKSQDLDILIDDRGAAASGTVSLIDLKTGSTRHVEVGIHPTAIVVSGPRAYVANTMSDSVSEIDIASGKVTRTIPLRWGSLRLLGGMPNALAIRGKTLYVADGGDNAVAEVDLDAGVVRGYRHAGYFPIAIALDRDGQRAYVLNSKGNGSVSQTTLGKPGNAHDFQGLVTVLNLASDLKAETAIVVAATTTGTPTRGIPT